jgi:hypothetical protein
MASSIWRFSTTRMLREYVELLFLPAGVPAVGAVAVVPGVGSTGPHAAHRRRRHGSTSVGHVGSLASVEAEAVAAASGDGADSKSADLREATVHETLDGVSGEAAVPREAGLLSEAALDGELGAQLPADQPDVPAARAGAG